ncbi:MAG TPA: hypothetical protein VNJ03_16270 [Vicinamibacterales bacterium]|nr:hypothetical protein [Vicinamibacterales bacterium]
MAVFLSFLLTLRHCARSRAVLPLELLALRHQLAGLKRSRPRRLRLAQADRLLWVWLSRVWSEWRVALLGQCGVPTTLHARLPFWPITLFETRRLWQMEMEREWCWPSSWRYS